MMMMVIADFWRANTMCQPFYKLYCVHIQKKLYTEAMEKYSLDWMSQLTPHPHSLCLLLVWGLAWLPSSGKASLPPRFAG